MITGVSSLDSIYHQKNSNSVAFTGLTNRMSKKIYNWFYSMEALFPKDHMQSPISGKLPGFMFYKIKAKTSNIKEGIMEIFDTFAQVSNELRDFEPSASSTYSEVKYRRSDSTVKKLEKVLLKYDIIKPWDEFNIKYIDKGGKGAVYKLDGLRDFSGTKEDEFVMKVFHSKSVQQNAYHGCFPEINAASYWMKHLGTETNRGKFFWADVKEAYMVNKYIDEDVRIAKRVPYPYDYGVKFTDENAKTKHNICKGYSYDWGGSVVINQSVNSNKYARSIMHKIKNCKEKFRLCEWYGIFYKVSGGNEDNKFAGLTLSIKYLPESFKVRCFEQCYGKRGKYNDRALGYALKYLPFDVSVEHYKKLLSSTKDPVLKKILSIEIPFISVKDTYKSIVKDDRIDMNGLSGVVFNKYVDKDRYQQLMDIAKEYHIL